MDALPKRKTPRLPGWDYSSPGAYFVTVCTQGRKNLFAPVGADSISARMVERTFLETIGRYKGVSSPKYVVMSNHFHAMITIERADMESAPTIPRIMQDFKRYSTLEYIKLVKRGILPPFEGRIWQRSYHDHIIRSEADYLRVWEYMTPILPSGGRTAFTANKKSHPLWVAFLYAKWGCFLNKNKV